MKKRFCTFLILILIMSMLTSCGWLSKDVKSQSGSNEGKTLSADDSMFFYVTEDEDLISDPDTGLTYAKGELILAAKPDISESQVENALARESGEIVGRIEILNYYQALFLNSYSPEELDALCGRLLDTGLFESCDLNLATEVSESYYPTSDSVWKKLWGEKPEGDNWGVEAVRAPQMWDYRDQMDWVNVGVLDTQFYSDHEDLDFSGLYYETDYDKSQASHGTHVSGTIAAGFDNGKGISGVAPKARLYGVSTIGIESSDSVTVFTYVAGLTTLIATCECRVINMSTGYEETEFAASRGNAKAINNINEYNKQLEKALLSLIAKGYDFLIVKSAGNQNAADKSSGCRYNPSGDAPYGYVRAEKGSEYGNVFAHLSPLSGIENPIIKDRVIVVGALEKLKDGTFQVADFSNRGDRVDILAPGTDIQSTVAKSSFIFWLKSGYEGGWNGTSMAVPHVSGVAASIFGARPDLSGPEVKRIIIESAGRRTYGYADSAFPEKYPLLNGEAAIQVVLGSAKPQSTEFSVPSEMTLTIGETSIIEPEGMGTGLVTEWVSSNPGIATVDEDGIIYGKSLGQADITVTAIIDGETHTGVTSLTVAPIARDSILILDISGSMEGAPLSEMKRSAIAFCEAVITDSSAGNRVGLVLYDTDVYTYDLSSDADSLITAINNLECGSRTNLQGGLQSALEMMDAQGRAGSIKNIIVMADGLPNEGFYSTYGQFSQKYSHTDYYTEYADAAFETSQQITQKYNLYSLGFFHSLSGEELSYAEDILTNIQNKGYYTVGRAEDLAFVFAEITTDISSGARLVINIACPVDVEVSYGGESLNSSAQNYSGYASFGTLQLLGKNRDVKVLTLTPDVDYTIELWATGEGKMNYTSNYFSDGELPVDSRSFPGVPLTPTTYITSGTGRSEPTRLDIDRDGDGEVDIIWEAGSNGVGKEIWSNRGLPALEIALITTVILCSAAIIFAIVLRTRQQQGYGIRPISLSPFDPERPCGSVQILKGTMAGAEIPLWDGESLKIGRDSKWANLIINEKSISRKHCSIKYNGAENCYFVMDESAYGTYLSPEQKLSSGTEHRIEANSRLSLASENTCVILLK